MAERSTSRLGQTWPEREEFRRLAEGATLVPVCRQILADLETPVSAFLKIHRGRYGFLLESVQGGEQWGRYSFLGTEPAMVLAVRGDRVRLERPATGGAVEERISTDPMGELQRVLRPCAPRPVPGLPRFAGGAVGYVGYDVVRSFERLPAEKPADLDLPDACLLMAANLLVFDNVAQTITALVNAPVGDGIDPERAYDDAIGRLDDLLARLAARPRRRPAARDEPPVAVRSNVSSDDYQAAVRRAKEYIQAGDIIQVVLSQRFELPLRAAPFDVYRALRTRQSVALHVLSRLGDLQTRRRVARGHGAGRDGELTLRPIAGTRPRGAREDEDRGLAAELLADPKERAEHIMLVDFGRNDVGRVCAPSAASRCPTGWWSSGTPTSCTSSRTCGGGSRPAGRLRRSAPRSPPGRSPVRPRSAPWRSSRSWSRCAAALRRGRRLRELLGKPGHLHHHPDDSYARMAVTAGGRGHRGGFRPRAGASRDVNKARGMLAPIEHGGGTRSMNGPATS